jgi:hypothetical protein
MTRTAAVGQAATRGEVETSRIDLFPQVDQTVRLVLTPGVFKSRHRFRIELQGARAQAEDWLHSAGFSLLEERDVEGRRSYAVLSGALISDGPLVRLHARVGNPQLWAGLHLRRAVPAIGVTMPWREFTVEMEGVADKTRGYLMMASLCRSDALQRVRYGIALPIAVGAHPSIGALFQLQVRIDP